MALHHSDLSSSRHDDGLIFDAEGVTLLAQFGDELSAYRARRAWMQVMGSYFLLERGRDFEMSVLSSPESGHHVLNCFFTSACGRYAFWRLINEQAPEAESKLMDSGVQQRKNPGYLTSIWSSLCEPRPAPRVLRGEDTTLNEEFGGDRGLMHKLRSLLK